MSDPTREALNMANAARPRNYTTVADRSAIAHGFDLRGVGCRCEWFSGRYGEDCPEHGTASTPIPTEVGARDVVIAQLEAENARLRSALAELVRLKALKEQGGAGGLAEHDRCKKAAWHAAAHALYPEMEGSPHGT
jgi:hypothetical protein